MPARLRDHLRVALIGLLLAFGGMAQQPLRVAYLAFPPRSDERGMVPDHLATTLGELKVAARPLLTDARAGKLALARTDVLIFGSWSNNEDALQATITRARADLHSFVSNGGVIVLFPQFWARGACKPELVPEIKDAAERRVFGFLEPEFKLEFSPQHYDRVEFVDSHHPLLSTPNAITPAIVNKWNGCWPTGVDSPLGAVNSHLILGHRYKLAYPWLQEVAIGRGLVVICAGALDRIKDNSNDETHDLLGNLLGNVLARATKLREKTAEKFEPTFKALPDTTQDAVVDFDDWKGFEDRVNTAVDRGVEALKKMQHADGSFGGFNVNYGPEHFPTGPTSLALMAIVASGVSKHDPVVEKAAKFLMEHTPSTTYENGLFLSAIEHKAAPLGERIEFLRLPPAERANFAFKRTLSPEEREALERATSWLVTARYRGVWSYAPYAKTADASNTQYGALGLLSAARCGVKVPHEAFEKIVEVYLSFQTKGSGTRPYAVPIGPTDQKAWPKFEMRAAPTGWWNYNPLSREPSGRATTDCIGIACLMLGLDGISGSGPGDQRKPKVVNAVDLAMNHLDSIFRVDVQGGDPGTVPDYYYLYTLERAMVLTEARFVGRHDWYREAADFLVSMQRRNGHWDTPGAQNRNDIIHTSFALLTLRRATIPSRTTLK